MSTRRAVIGGQIMLYSYIEHETKQRVSVCGKLPAKSAGDWDGTVIYVLDWKITDGNVAITYQTDPGQWAHICEVNLPVVTERCELRPPSKKNWVLEPCSDYWRNTRTGERRIA